MHAAVRLKHQAGKVAEFATILDYLTLPHVASFCGAANRKKLSATPMKCRDFLQCSLFSNRPRCGHAQRLATGRRTSCQPDSIDYVKKNRVVKNMNPTWLRILTAVIVSAAFASVVLAQNSPAPTRAEALAEARKGLAACEALPDAFFNKRGCVEQCSNAVKWIPTVNPERIPSWSMSCNASVRSALQFLERETAMAAEAAERQKSAQARAADEQGVGAKAAAATTPATPATTTPATTTLRADGAIDWGDFENELTFFRVFNGEFDSYRNGSLAARALMTFYLESFEDVCGDFLPPDTVTLVRKSILVTERGGIEVGREVTTTKIRMAPRFVNGYENYSAGRGMAAFIDVQRPDRMMKEAVEFLQTWRRDMDLFFATEACQGETMLQLGENIARLTSGRQPIQSQPDAGQLLAKLRVRVPPGVEEADTRVKRARAEAWWSEQRALWSNPPETQQYNFSASGGQIRIKYEAIAPDFAIPIPDTRPRDTVQIEVGKSYIRRISSIRIGYDNMAPVDINNFGPHADTYRKDTSAAFNEGARTLRCTYDAGGTLKTIEFWYRKNPQSLDLEPSRTTWPNHPLLKVRDARSDCPVAMP